MVGSGCITPCDPRAWRWARSLPSGFLDGTHTCHYRLMPLLFARESDHVVDTLREVAAPNKIKKVLKEYTPFKRMIYQERG